MILVPTTVSAALRKCWQIGYSIYLDKTRVLLHSAYAVSIDEFNHLTDNLSNLSHRTRKNIQMSEHRQKYTTALHLVASASDWSSCSFASISHKVNAHVSGEFWQCVCNLDRTNVNGKWKSVVKVNTILSADTITLYWCNETLAEDRAWCSAAWWLNCCDSFVESGWMNDCEGA